MVTIAVESSRWTTGLAFSMVASLIGALSKLCIRKSYTILEGNVVNPIPPCDETAKLSCEHTEDEESTDYDDSSQENIETVQLFSTNKEKQSNIMEFSSTNDESQWMRKCRAFTIRAAGVFGMTVLGPSCNIYALQFASPSILCPIGSGLALVWIVLLSDRAIGEKPRPLQVLAVGLIVIGEAVVSVAGDHTNIASLTLEDIRRQYVEPQFLAYFVGIVVWITILVLVINHCNSGWQRFAWGMIGGSITGVQNFIKDSLALLHGSDGSHFPPQLFAMLFLAGLLPLTGLLLLMQCMKRYDALYSASMFVGSLVVSSSIMAAVHYHTFDNIDRRGAFYYPVGLLTIISGTVTLAVESRLREESCAQEKHDTEKVQSCNYTRKYDYGSYEALPSHATPVQSNFTDFR
mmetsp:Transcript_18424/g.25350  ORF Transcript_18424/g.25350 Transcript_18424/m.25350 type:complete len:405 (-) Transcript_18424:50-1264(-)|eukprot:CAMPEP_0185729746 /NCGR_PEP_ID=MMETSP1171-20130828/7048_1 /TAXON_ID=374046 /ORGANISM="Helicotheca tamensis, Strain CCMP826" /LENGTH=404 /DNA_ID=CAMNT_0028398655 /DNA_START=77 /DNA_END=1288 /DNA_ORIENTATION=+